jgi:hypothetical protein
LKGAAVTTSALGIASAAAELEKAAGTAAAEQSLRALLSVVARSVAEWRETGWCAQEDQLNRAHSSPN